MFRTERDAQPDTTVAWSRRLQRPLDARAAAHLDSALRSKEIRGRDLLRALRPVSAAEHAPERPAVNQTSLSFGDRFGQPLTVAATVLLVILLGVLGMQALRASGWQDYHATVQALRITLEDGTVALLEPDSQIAVRYTRNERSVQFKGGDASFDVRHAPERPFVVSFAGGSAEAVGTRFVVHARGSEAPTLVRVTEGLVKIRSTRSLQPLVLGRDGVIQVKRGGELLPSPEGSQATATTLLDIAEHLNALNPGVRVKIEGRAREEHIAASLQDTAQLIEALKALDRFTVEQNGQTEVTVRLKGDRSHVVFDEASR